MNEDLKFLGKNVMDLTLQLEAGKQTWNIHPPVTLIPYHQASMNRWRNGDLCPGFDTKLLMMTDHTGTHVDAQTHFYPDGKGLTEMPLSSLMGDALFLDIAHEKQGNALGIEDIEKALQKTSENIKKADILILKCWQNAWGVGENFDRADALKGELAEYFLEKEIKLLGTDIATVDDLANPNKDIHVKLLGKNIPIIENLINLERLNVHRFHFMALPLNLLGATGSPVRALAFL